MGKFYTVLGLMSGTSMDGVDASIIKSDGNHQYSTILDKYFEYDKNIYQKLTNIRNKTLSQKDLEIQSNELNSIEREITLFHANAVNEILEEANVSIDFIGFHGQTIFHDSDKKISKQLGDGKLLSQLTKKIVVYDFRQNDLRNGGEGAPLTPIFHNAMANKINDEYKIGFPISFINIGGISNITKTVNKKNILKNSIYAYDIGPGNCLIDSWIRNNSKKKYDENGSIAKLGNTNSLILNQALENFKIESYNKSFDVKDFDISFVKGLSLEDGASTLTDYSAALIAQGIKYANGKDACGITKWLVCGGGRKNKYLIDCIKKNEIDFLNVSIEEVDKYNVDGDFVESQAFAYLAIRSYLNLPISYPHTTGCKIKSGCTGGVLVKNF
jgi:anhydro-N-acetylmuramic acid kinase